MVKTWTHTASWLSFYLIFFFTLGTTACTSTTTYQINRTEFEKLSDSSGLKSRPVISLKAEEIRVHERSNLRVDRSGHYRNLVPFHFSLNDDIITPSSESQPRSAMQGISGFRAVKDPSPFTLKPTDRFEVHTQSVAAGRALLIGAGIIAVTSLILIGIFVVNVVDE